MEIHSDTHNNHWDLKPMGLVEAIGKGRTSTQKVDVLIRLTNPPVLVKGLVIVLIRDMVTHHMVRKGNCLLMNKRKRIVGLKPNGNCLLLNSNRDLKPDLALIVVSKVTSLKLVLDRNRPDYLWEQWILFPPL